MFRRLSQHFPDFSATESSDAGQKAHHQLKRALLFGALLLGVSIGAPFLLSDPEPPNSNPTEGPSTTSSAESSIDRTPAPASPSPVDLTSPGVIIAFLLLAGGIGLAIYLRNHDAGSPAQNGILIPVAEYPLATDQKLQLIRCADELLLLATSPDGTSLLKTYSAEQILVNGEHPATAVGRAENGTGDNAFATVLKRYASQYASNHRS